MSAITVQGPMQPIGAMPAPEGVDEERWQAVVAAAPWLTSSDVLVTTALCHAWRDYDDARALVEREGSVHVTKDGVTMQTAYYRMAMDRRYEVIRLARELGMTPLVRAQVRK